MANLTQTTAEVQEILDNNANSKIDATSVKIGTGAGEGSTGINNVAIGTNALNSVNAADDIVAIGFNALAVNDSSGGVPSGAYNTAVGSRAMQANTTGNHNTAVGWWAMKGNTTGYNNTAIGQDALLANTTGFTNTAVGHHCMEFNTEGDGNIAVGSAALNSNTTGSKNTVMGISALFGCTTGSNNVAIGENSGYQGANPLTESSNCTFIGTRTSIGVAGTLTNSTAIGYGASIKGSNQVVIGDYNITDVYLGNKDIGTMPKLWCGKLSLSALPTSASGLSSGDVWSNSNVLTIVP